MNPLDLPAFFTAVRAEATARGFTTHTFGDTPAGPLLAFTRQGHGPPAYLSAGIHGDEPAGPLAALELLRSSLLKPDRTWTICPALNPVGLAAGTRENGAGVDLNRDYLRLRSAEVRAHRHWLETQPPPALFLSLHEDWESTGFYLYEINSGVDVPARAAAILEAVRPSLPPEPAETIDDHAVRAPGWIFHAAEADFPEEWPEAIFIAKSGCPLSFTFETPSSAPLALRIAAHLAAVSTAI